MFKNKRKGRDRKRFFQEDEVSWNRLKHPKEKRTPALCWDNAEENVFLFFFIFPIVSESKNTVKLKAHKLQWLKRNVWWSRLIAALFLCIVLAGNFHVVHDSILQFINKLPATILYRYFRVIEMSFDAQIKVHNLHTIQMGLNSIHHRFFFHFVRIQYLRTMTANMDLQMFCFSV